MTCFADMSITSVAPATSNSARCLIFVVREMSMALFHNASFALSITFDIKEYRHQRVIGNIRLLGHNRTCKEICKIETSRHMFRFITTNVHVRKTATSISFLWTWSRSIKAANSARAPDHSISWEPGTRPMREGIWRGRLGVKPLCIRCRLPLLSVLSFTGCIVCTGCIPV